MQKKNRLKTAASLIHQISALLADDSTDSEEESECGSQGKVPSAIQAYIFPCSTKYSLSSCKKDIGPRTLTYVLVFFHFKTFLGLRPFLGPFHIPLQNVKV